MTPEQKELIEEKFKGVHALIQGNFDVVNSELAHIKEQTTKTNGRVNKLESIQNNCPNMGKVSERVSKLEKFQWKAVGYFVGGAFVIGVFYKLMSL